MITGSCKKPITTLFGSPLRISHPFGDFTPDTESDTPIVLLSADVGITPMISVQNTITTKNPTRHVVFGHAARGRGYHPHQAATGNAKLKMPDLQIMTFYEEMPVAHGSDHAIQEGRMDITKLPQWARVDTDVYLCGPVQFMQEQ